MAEDLLRWRRQSDYASDDDYVFASETMKGKQPYWPDNLMKRHIQASCEGKWHSQEHRLAYFPAFLRHIAEGERRGCQNRSGALTAREQQDHARCLHASSELEQASRTEQGCKDDGVQTWVKWRMKNYSQNRASSGLIAPLSNPDFDCHFRCHTFRKSFGMYGGDDGARTRDLCRDRAAS